jgi:hypothetical protein
VLATAACSDCAADARSASVGPAAGCGERPPGAGPATPGRSAAGPVTPSPPGELPLPRTAVRADGSGRRGP